MPWGQGGFPGAIGAAAGLLIKPSGDTGGTTDTTNITSALALLNGPGAVYLAPGAVYITANKIVTTLSPRYICGSGQWATIVNGVGTGDVFRMYNNFGSTYLPGGGGVIGLTMDGTSMGAGSSGLHWGDIYNFTLDVGFQNFTGAGSKGMWADNQYLFAEQARGRVWTHKCSTAAVFDNSANLSGLATGSFDRAVLDIFLDQKGAGNGVIFTNGAFMEGQRLGIYGNTDYGAALYYVLTLTGSNAGGFSRIGATGAGSGGGGVLNIDVECNATTGTQPGTINFATGGSNTISDCT